MKMTKEIELKSDILFQLGAPVVQIELSSDQIEYAICSAERWSVEQGLADTMVDQAKVRNYAVAMATMILGRVKLECQMDGETLLRDARLRFEALGCGPYG